MEFQREKGLDKYMDKLNSTTYKEDVKLDPKDRIEVEVGDSKQVDFKPQVKIMRWDNEVNFSMRAEEKEGAEVVEEEGKIKYITPEYEVHQYSKPEAGEDGGFEFEWVLPKKPASNVLTATIQTKGLNFFYQPALTQEEIDEGASRPENVVGSYAVYHKTKGGMNDAAGMEYKVGKAFHIYRPKAIDAKGTEVWGELNIDEQNGLLKVTIDKDFLDNAVYPVTVDPTFGYTTVGGTPLAGQGAAAPKVASMVDQLLAATSGSTVVSYSVYGNISNVVTPNTIQMTSYTVTSSQPNALLATGTSMTVTNDPPEWYTSSAVSQALTNGVTYCVALGFSTLTGGGEFAPYYDAGSTPGRFSSTSATFLTLLVLVVQIVVDIILGTPPM